MEEAWVVRHNLAELLLTRGQLTASCEVLHALRGHVGDEACDTVLAGTFIRGKARGVYCLQRVLTCHLQDDGPPSLQLEGVAKPASGDKISDSNPFAEDADDLYESTGRAELLCLQDKLAHGRERAVLDRATAAAAIWRKKVVLGWAPKLEEYCRTMGISKLVADMQDVSKLDEQAASMHPAIKQLPPGSHSPHLQWHQPLQPLLELLPQGYHYQPLSQPPPEMLIAPGLGQAAGGGGLRDPRTWLMTHQAARAPTAPMVVTSQAAVDLAPLKPHTAPLSTHIPQRLLSGHQEGFLPAASPGSAAASPFERAPSSVGLAKLVVFGLPADASDGSVAAFFRGIYPSVHSARMWPLPVPVCDAVSRHATVRFLSTAERDAALVETPRRRFSGQALLAALPDAEQGSQAAAPPSFGLFVRDMPPQTTESSMAAFFRQHYPSVLRAKLLFHTEEEVLGARGFGGRRRRGLVHFGLQSERDTALREMNRTTFLGHIITMDVPYDEKKPWKPSAITAFGSGAAATAAVGTPAVGQPVQQAVEGGRDAGRPDFPLYVLNIGDALSTEHLLLYFKERYPSVISANLAISKAGRAVVSQGYGIVRFSSDAERQRAKTEMDGHVLPGGRKIGTGLPPSSASQLAAAVGAPGVHAAALTGMQQQQAPLVPAMEGAVPSLTAQPSGPQMAVLQLATPQLEAPQAPATLAQQKLGWPANLLAAAPPVSVPVAAAAAGALPSQAALPAVVVRLPPGCSPEQQQQQLQAIHSGLSSSGWFYAPGTAAATPEVANVPPYAITTDSAGGSAAHQAPAVVGAGSSSQRKGSGSSAQGHVLGMQQEEARDLRRRSRSHSKAEEGTHHGHSSHVEWRHSHSPPRCQQQHSRSPPQCQQQHSRSCSSPWRQQQRDQRHSPLDRHGRRSSRSPLPRHHPRSRCDQSPARRQLGSRWSTERAPHSGSQRRHSLGRSRIPCRMSPHRQCPGSDGQKSTRCSSPSPRHQDREDRCLSTSGRKRSADGPAWQPVQPRYSTPDAAVGRTAPRRSHSPGLPGRSCFAAEAGGSHRGNTPAASAGWGEGSSHPPLLPPGLHGAAGSWREGERDCRSMPPSPGHGPSDVGAGGNVPPRLLRLFLDACHELVCEQGLPIELPAVHWRMDQLCRRDCFRGTGITMGGLLRLMEEHGTVRLRRTAGIIFIDALL